MRGPHLAGMLTAALLLLVLAILVPVAQAPAAVKECPPVPFAIVHPVPPAILQELEQYIGWRQMRLLRPLEYVETRQRAGTLVYSVKAIGETAQGWQTVTIDIGLGTDGTVRCCIER